MAGASLSGASLAGASLTGASLGSEASLPQAARANTMQSARTSARIFLILFYLSSSILPGFAGVCWGLLGDAG
ncbi:MAG: pentapeptide repeat-containing protein [Oscillospiraceae bacterium]